MIDRASVCSGEIGWPRKLDLFGVGVSSTTYSEVVEILMGTAKRKESALVDFAPASVLVEAERDSVFRSKLNSFDLVCPDGQAVRWTLNFFHHAGLRDRVCGTTTMLRLCQAAASAGFSIYLYGTTPETLRRLQNRLLTTFPNLKIAGAESPPFRPLTLPELDGAIERINNSGAAFLFVGIGSPKQEAFAWDHRGRIQPIQLCVGAAFDFIAETKKRAPLWMQNMGLEWLFRVLQEPLRLGRRYVVGNTRFLFRLSLEVLRLRWVR